MTQPETRQNKPARANTLAEGRDWSISKFVCAAGPGDRPFEERRARVAIAAVLDGTFTHKSDTGTALLHPGAFLLGNADQCFECGHDHGTGDTCVALQIEPEYFSEIAATVSGSARYQFTTGMIPALPECAPLFVTAETRLTTANALAADEAVATLISTVIAIAAGTQPSPARISARDARRISAAVEHIEQNCSEPITLDALATVARMSKFHFLRCFRRAVGVTPHQLLLGIRLRRAARALASSHEPIAAIAFDAGFGDLSTFNNRFRTHFGENPSEFRRRERRRG